MLPFVAALLMAQPSPPAEPPDPALVALQTMVGALRSGDLKAAREQADRTAALLADAPVSALKAAFYFNRALLSHAEKRPAQAEKWLEQARSAYVAALGASDPNVRAVDDSLIHLLSGEGSARYASGDYAGAEAVWSRGLAACERAYGERCPSRARLLNRRGTALTFMGRYPSALADLNASLALEDSPVVRGNLALALKKMGRLKSAASEYETTVLGLRGKEGSESLLGVLLDNLGNLRREAGDFVTARAHFEEAAAIFAAHLPDGHSSVSVNLNNYAALLKEMGDAGGAERRYRKALAGLTQQLGATHPEVGVVTSNLASTLSDQGQYREALSVYERALAITRRALGPEHLEVAVLLNNMAWAERQMGASAAAVERYKVALAIQERGLGKRHPTTAITLANMGNAILDSGDPKRAVTVLRRAERITRRALGASHLHTAERIAALAYAEQAAGSLKAARKHALAALRIVRAGLEPLLWATSERERVALVALQQDKVHLLLMLGTDVRATYDALLHWKAVALASLVSQRELLKGNPGPEIEAELRTLARVRSELATLTVGAPNSGGPLPAERVEALTETKDALERGLAQRSAAFRAERSWFVADVDAVCAALGPERVLVDFVRFTARRPNARRLEYSAFVLRGGPRCELGRVDLGAAAPIDDAVADFRKHLYDEEGPALVERLRVVRARVFDPLVGQLGGRRRVVLVPDGSLAEVPFAALPVGAAGEEGVEGRFLVHRYTFGSVPTARALVRGGMAQEASRGALVVGGVDYGAPGEGGVATANRSAGCGLAGQAFTALPASEGEAGLVAKTIGPQVRVLDGLDATEESVVAALQQSQRVHLATHGYFAGDCLRQFGRLNPLVTSGVALSRANTPQAGHADGILTAEEVSALDLSGLELAVLSACETGLGDIRDGTGVLGLRWAFAVAGARALVMSLWKVPDEETRSLMTQFYRGLERSPGDVPAALRAAQIALIKQLRETNGDTNPWLWAAFVVSGG